MQHSATAGVRQKKQPGTTSDATAPRPQAVPAKAPELTPSAPELTLADCSLEELFVKDALRAAGVLAEIHTHTAPLHAAFATYATEAPPTKRKLAKNGGQRPAVMCYDAWCRFVADLRLPKKAVKASTEHIYSRSQSLEDTTGRKPSEGHLLFAEFVGGLVRLALQQHKVPPPVKNVVAGQARSSPCGHQPD